CVGCGYDQDVEAQFEELVLVADCHAAHLVGQGTRTLCREVGNAHDPRVGVRGEAQSLFLTGLSGPEYPNPPALVGAAGVRGHGSGPYVGERTEVSRIRQECPTTCHGKTTVDPHRLDFLDDREIGLQVTGDDDDVGALAFVEAASLRLEAEQFGCADGGCL